MRHKRENAGIEKRSGDKNKGSSSVGVLSLKMLVTKSEKGTPFSSRGKTILCFVFGYNDHVMIS